MDTTATNQPTVEINLDSLDSINYTLLSAGKSVVNSCSIKNTGKHKLANLKVRLKGHYLEDKEYDLGVVSSGESISLDRLSADFDMDFLYGLQEPVASRFTLEISSAGTTFQTNDFAIQLYPKDYWLGEMIHPETIAAFVTPNTPAVQHVLQNAGKWLERFTGNCALDEYQTRDNNRVRWQVAAIYEALREEAVVYAAPPASFGKNGQRVRLAEQVLADKLGTCLDLSLLFASCLEQANLNPLIIIMKDHAFVGCWLEDTHYPETVCDDYAILSKNIADGIHRLVVVEATCVTSSANVSFEEAASMAEAHLNEANNLIFVDVKSSRLQHVYPLSSPRGKEWGNTGVEHSHATRHIQERLTLREDEPTGKSPLSREQIWERKLLDISLRNNLVNMRLGTRCLPIFAFNPEFMEDELQKGKSYKITANPNVKQVKLDENGFIDSRSYRITFEEQINENIRSGLLSSYLGEAELGNTLTALYRESRTAQEENGANSLFLALGILKWYETPKSVKPRFAPLLLLPVEIIRKGKEYVIRMRDEDIFFNTALEEMLKQNFDLHIPGLTPLPADETGCDVRRVFTLVRNAIMSQQRWDVLEESVLGLFSFSKFVMWNDVHSNLENMRQNPIISALLNKGTLLSQGEFTDASAYDSQIDPQENAIPVDVDASQLEAVLESGKGKSFILYGPPGTGKSQTITNMIANALFHGKRVLFVAEKMAALEVVQKRLAKIGLAPFCLELHSNKATKGHLLTQLQETLNLVRYKSPETYASTAEKLLAQRREQDHFAKAMHQPREDGLSLYEYIGKYTALKGCETITPSEAFLESADSGTVGEAAAEIRLLEKVIAITGHPASHPLLGLLVKSNAPSSLARVRALLDKLSGQAATAVALCRSFGRSLGFDDSTSIKYLPLYSSLASLAELVSPDAFSMPAAVMIDRWHEACGRWFLPRYFAKRKVLAEVQQHCRVSVTADNIEGLLSALNACQEQAAAHAVSPDSLAHIRLDAEGLRNIASFHSTWRELGELADVRVDDLQELSGKIKTWLANFALANQWLHWCSACRTLEGKHLGRVVEYIQQNTAHTPSAATDAMLKGYYEYRINRAIDEDASLQLFNGLVFDEKIKAYKQMEDAFRQLTIEMLYCRLASQVPSANAPSVDTSELGLLKRFISSKGRGVSIRRIMDLIPTLLPKLCPVMLMSPISVAQYLDLNQEKFDLVCFDEASQMPTSEAVGAIARGRALICVGDPKQMPPTSFFSANTVDEEDAENDDMESILDDCITLSMPEKHLNWHYRSKHESLIAFSNSQYYDGKLYTFPSTDDKAVKVRCVKVEGSYDHGRTRCNRAEAAAIVSEVVRRLQSAELSQKSIGIIAFSKVQQNLIEDMLTDRLSADPLLEQKAFEVEEPMFVKNLENVQGDERDVILFSVGYGPNAAGKVSMNFGPLNRIGGERRLNVAVSRARYEMIVYTIMSPEQIDLRRTNSLGVAGLRHFLEFAQTGKISIPAGQREAAEAADITAQIAAKLRERGFAVETHVGRSRFKIDLAIQHPKQKDIYILGLLCDGKGYRMTKTAGERVVSQPGFLKYLGWNIMRIWSLDWLNNEEMVLQRIQQCIAMLVDGDGNVEPTPAVNVSASPVLAEAAVVSEDIESATGQDYIPATFEKDADEGLTTDQLFSSAYPVSADILQVVKAEQPITLDLLCKRIAHRYRILRVTRKFRDLTTNCLTGLYVDTTYSSDNPTLWESVECAANYQDYRMNGGRDISEIPPCEICNALYRSVEQQVALPKDALKRFTSRQLGYTNMGARIDKTLEVFIGDMVDSGVFQIQGDKISLNRLAAR